MTTLFSSALNTWPKHKGSVPRPRKTDSSRPPGYGNPAPQGQRHVRPTPIIRRPSGKNCLLRELIAGNGQRIDQWIQKKTQWAGDEASAVADLRCWPAGLSLLVLIFEYCYWWLTYRLGVYPLLITMFYFEFWVNPQSWTSCPALSVKWNLFVTMSFELHIGK